MDDVSTSGPIDRAFISESDLSTTYEDIPSRGFNQLVKVRRQGRWFILKGLKEEYREQDVYLNLLRKEFALMVRLDHPNIVKAYSKEVHDTLGPCIVMEYVDGVSLDEFLEGKPSMDARKKVVDQIVDALIYIHGKQILHRDLKPDNILITRNGNNVKILDFGLSDADDYAVFKQPAGTLKYMAPEQAHVGEGGDCRSDQFSFGLILRKIFPRRYRQVAAKCTREDPERRFEGMEDVHAALLRKDRQRRIVPFICLVLSLILAWGFSSRHQKASLKTDLPQERILSNQEAWIKESLWTGKASLQDLFSEAEKGEEWREVLLERLSRLNLSFHTAIAERGKVYEADSPELLQFVSLCNRDRNETYLRVMKAIERSCPSFEEEYSRGRMTQRAYDSLRWVVSPIITTLPAKEITSSSAVGEALLSEERFANEAEVGICWSPCHGPTIEGRHATGRGNILINNLAPASTYFVRSYVRTKAGVFYGPEVSFKTAYSTFEAPKGAVKGLFSTGKRRQVYFSKGNLQYQASTSSWRFAENQYDFKGRENTKLSETYDGWIDLFGWGTSGYRHGAVDWQPYAPNKDTQSDPLHYAYGKAEASLYEGDGRADWGFNRIVNGGNEEGLWRTPRIMEWVYLLFIRNTASGARFAKAKISGVNGLMLLPDGWSTAIYPLNSVNLVNADFVTNSISSSDWSRILEPAGVVFLPEAGARTVDGFFSYFGGYYSSDATSTDAWHLLFEEVNVYFDARGHRGDGLSVRLVRTAVE